MKEVVEAGAMVDEQKGRLKEETVAPLMQNAILGSQNENLNRSTQFLGSWAHV